MRVIKRFILWLRRKKIVKRINKALKVKLKKWQIAFIFYGASIPAEIQKERCNGKTLAHILRLCLCAYNGGGGDLYDLTFLRRGRAYVKRIAYGEDGESERRAHNFEWMFFEVYASLVKIKRIYIPDFRASERNCRVGTRLYIKIF